VGNTLRVGDKGEFRGGDLGGPTGEGGGGVGGGEMAGESFLLGKRQEAKRNRWEGKKKRMMGEGTEAGCRKSNDLVKKLHDTVEGWVKKPSKGENSSKRILFQRITRFGGRVGKVQERKDARAGGRK